MVCPRNKVKGTLGDKKMKITKKLLKAVRLECIRARGVEKEFACLKGFCQARYECDCIRFFSKVTNARDVPCNWENTGDDKEIILKEYKRQMKKKRKKNKKRHPALNAFWLKKKKITGDKK